MAGLVAGDTEELEILGLGVAAHADRDDMVEVERHARLSAPLAPLDPAFEATFEALDFGSGVLDA